jgi:hypothetical protein
LVASAVPEATQKRASDVRPLETVLLFITFPLIVIGWLTSIVPVSARARAIRLVVEGTGVGVGEFVGTGVGVLDGVGVAVPGIGVGVREGVGVAVPGTGVGVRVGVGVAFGRKRKLRFVTFALLTV